MNKKLTINIFFTIVSILTVLILSSFNNLKWLNLLIGISLMLISIPFYFLGKEKNKFKYIVIILNTLAMGFFITTYFKVKNLNLDITKLLLSSLIILGISIMFNYLKNINKKYNKLIIILYIILFIILFHLWIQNESNIFYSFSFLILIPNFMYYFIKQENDLLTEISTLSFGIGVLLFIVILSILTEGNVDIDLPLSDNSKTKKVIK